MTDETSEPTNKQLASFLVIYARHIPELGAIFGEMALNQDILERQMDLHPEFRETALQHHRGFQEQIEKGTRLMMAGKLQCEGRTKKGKRCPNRNEPGSFYCGLHKDQEEQG